MRTQNYHVHLLFCDFWLLVRHWVDTMDTSEEELITQSKFIRLLALNFG